MTINDLLREFKLDAILGLDFETYFSADYCLGKGKGKLATTDYIFDQRFKSHCAAVQWHDEPKAVVVRDPRKLFVRKRRIGVLAHHTHFDGLILAKHFKIAPAMYFDTLSMARALMPIHVPLNLDGLAKALGLKGKVRKQALENIKGIRDLSPAQYKALADYAGDDIGDTWHIFRKLLPFFTQEELEIIDITVRMYTQPTVRINAALALRVNEGETAKKAGLVEKLGLTREDFTSNNRFAEILRSAGVEPPTKKNKKGQTTLALAKNDLVFKALLKHSNKKVRELVEARLALKTSIVETRSAMMHNRSSYGAQPIYLNYWGARRTGRWSGADGANWQNLGRGSDLRRSIRAPAGYRLIISDQSQIEARMNAWLARYEEKLEAFRAYDRREGPDVYRITASRDIYHKPIEEITGEERFVGKTAELGLGYGAGAPKFANMLRVGQFGPPVEIEDQKALEIVTRWRQGNHLIVSHWKAAERAMKMAFCNCVQVKHGPVVFEGRGDYGIVLLPNGTTLRYDGLQRDDEGGLSYINEVRFRKDGSTYVERNRLYGGLIVENLCQALSRVILAGQMAKIARAGFKLVTCTHDEVLIVAKTAAAKRTHDKVVQIMSKPPDWAKDLPLSVGSTIKAIYEKD